MNSLIVLFVFLIVVVSFCIATSKKIVLNPQVCFVVSFIPQVFYAFFLKDVWDIYLCDTTVYIYFVGILNFVIVSLIVSFNNNRIHNVHLKIKNKKTGGRGDIYSSMYQGQGRAFIIQKWKLVLFICFQIFAILLASRSLIQVTGASSLGQAASLYNSVNKYGKEPYHLPFVIGQFRHICEASGYIWAYYLASSIVYKNKKNRSLLLVNFVLSMISPMILGQRLGSVRMVCAFAFMIYVIYGSKVGWKFRVKGSTVIKTIIIIAIIPLAFYYSLDLMGRSTERTLMEYLGIYLSGELKIFDTFVRKGEFGRAFLESQTISTIIRYIAKWFNISNLGQKDYYPFLYVAGISIGNASTIFYNYYLDGGYLGVIIYTGILAFISQLSFRRAISNDNGHVKISLIAYCYIFFCLIFAFFDDFFFKQVVSPIFAFYIVYWMLIRWFIKLKIKVERVRKS